MPVAKITRKQLYVAAKTIDANSRVAEGAKLRSYDAGCSDETIAEFVGASVPQIRRVRLDIFGPFAEVKKPTAKERIAELEAENERLRKLAEATPVTPVASAPEGMNSGTTTAAEPQAQQAA